MSETDLPSETSTPSALRSRKKTMALVLGAVLLLIGSIAIGVGIKKHSVNLSKAMPDSEFREIKWDDLVKLDYQTGKGPEELMNLHKTLIKMPGFIVPLSDDLETLSEFLLVPNPQACIHVPPPPPNLIVHVHLAEPVPFREVFNPSWIYGTLRIETATSQYGAASYQVDAVRIKKYEYPKRGN